MTIMNFDAFTAEILKVKTNANSDEKALNDVWKKHKIGTQQSYCNKFHLCYCINLFLFLF